MKNDQSRASIEAQLLHLTRQALSAKSRYGHMALLLGALMMCVLLGALLWTETGLPGRTQAALSVMLAIGVCWVGYALWVLTHRKTLLANHRVVAGWMAVAFTTLFLAGTAALAWVTGGNGYLAAVGMGMVMLAVAIFMLVRAHRRVGRLRALLRELERQREAQT